MMNVALMVKAEAGKPHFRSDGGASAKPKRGTLFRKTLTILASSLMLVAFVSGCASIERTSPGMMDGLDVVGGDTPAVETIVVRNSGYGFFYAFCGVCGDVRYDNEANNIKGGLVFFNNICECGDCYRTVQAVANNERKSLTNVSMFNNTLPSGAVTSYLQLLGFLIEVGDVGCSGVLRAKK